MTEEFSHPQADGLLRAANQITERILDEIDRFFLDTKDTEIKRIYTWCGLRQGLVPEIRVLQSMEEKQPDDTLFDPDTPDSVTSDIRIWIATPNKKQARIIFDYLWRSYRHEQWLKIDINGPISFNNYTKESYEPSRISGYQAYHINFVYDSKEEFANECDTKHWNIEIRIMSQLWKFYADYSRRHLGRSLEDWSIAGLSTTVSNILDSADDLMTLAQEELISSVSEKPVVSDEAKNMAEAVRIWLTEERLKLLSHKADIPNPMFRVKMHKTADRYGVTLDDVDKFIRDSEVKERFERLINSSPGLTYLPPFQSFMTHLMLGKGMSFEEVVAAVNPELWPLGYQLHVPTDDKKPSIPIHPGTVTRQQEPKSGLRMGRVQEFIIDKQYGWVLDSEDDHTYSFVPEAFTTHIDPILWSHLPGQPVTFMVKYSDKLRKDIVAPKSLTFIDEQFRLEIEKMNNE